MKWIDSQTALAEVVEEALGCDTIAVDTEADSLHSYFEKVCLIQVSTPDNDYIIDPLALDPAPVGTVLASPDTVKVFHGADYDLRITNRDFGFTTRSLIDTMICAQLLGEEKWGLAALLKKYFDVELDKSHQRADWSARPLRPSMMEYAAMDTRYLAGLARELRTRLEALGRWEWAIEEFERLEEIRHAPDEDDERFRKLKGAGKLSRRSLAVLERIWRWREEVAQRRDVPPFKVIGNDALVAIAEKMPSDQEALQSVKSVGRNNASRHGRRILAMVAEARDLPENELPEKRVLRPWIRDRRTEKLVDRLKVVRNAVAAELAIDPSVLAPKHVLTSIATSAITSPDALDEIPAMRRWQRDILAPRLLAELDAG